MTVGFSEKATALAPFPITRLSSSTAKSTSSSGRITAPKSRSGAVAPLVEQIVVVGAQALVPEVPVRDVQVEAVPGEPCVVGEAELSPHAVDIHVGDAATGS